MDFFKQQDIARRKSYFLIFLFVISISILVIVSNIVVSFILSIYYTKSLSFYREYLNIKIFFLVSIPLIFSMFLITYYKLKEFNNITSVLHNYFNATLVKRYKANSSEKVFLNIIDEISIASGIPPIHAYVMEDLGINSFVIGTSSEDAAIVVTRTALEKLTRDELQAMIAHEFAKIFTNDMRLNINLTAVTYSLLSISQAGNSIIYYMLDSEYNSNKKRFTFAHPIFIYGMLVLGLFLFLFGIIGYIQGNLIKYLILRQRIYLNDSITIEYIRNPIALIKLLKVSSTHKSVLTYHDIYKHAYFIPDNTGFFSRLFNIYPNAMDRIDRLKMEGISDISVDTNGIDKKTEVKNNSKNEELKNKLFNKENIVQTVTGFAMLDNFSKVKSYGKIISTKKESLPEFMHKLLSDLESTKALIISLLLSSEEKYREEQFNLINNEDLKKLVLQNYKQVKNLEGEYNLLIYFYSLGILKQLSIDEYRKYRNILNKIIYLDDILDIFEWNIENILIRQLDTHFSLRSKKEEIYFNYEDLQYSLEIFLSLISYSQESENIKASKCFDVAVEVQDMYSLNFVNKKDISNRLLKKALEDIEQCNLELRKKILETCVVCICVDNIIENWEIELIYSISILLKIPLPFFKLENETF